MYPPCTTTMDPLEATIPTLQLVREEYTLLTSNSTSTSEMAPTPTTHTTIAHADNPSTDSNNPVPLSFPPRRHTPRPERGDLHRKINVGSNQGSRRKKKTTPHFNSLMSTPSFWINVLLPQMPHNSNTQKGEEKMSMAGVNNSNLINISHPGNL